MIRAATTLLACSVALACIAIGCSAPTPPVVTPNPALQIPLLEQHFGTITANIDDQVGLVVSAEKLADPRLLLGSENGVVVADPGGNSLDVAWVSGVCRFGPTVTVRGTSDDLVVRIQPSAGEGLPPDVMCDSMGVFLGIKLHLSTKVEQDAITVEMLL